MKSNKIEPIRKPEFACFDLDGTLTRRDSFRLFFWHLMTHHYITKHDIVHFVWTFAMRKCRFISLHEAKERLLYPLRGKKRHDIERISLEFWNTTLSKELLASIVNRLDWHKAQGHYTILLTSAPDLYLPIIKRKLDLHDAFGTPLQFDAADEFTGKLGTHLFGNEKVRKIRKIIYTGSTAPSVVYAYSDHHSDLPLLEFSTYPHVVYPTRQLMDRARRNGWPVFS